jgi:hypothetical protein
MNNPEKQPSIDDQLTNIISNQMNKKSYSENGNKNMPQNRKQRRAQKSMIRKNVNKIKREINNGSKSKHREATTSNDIVATNTENNKIPN